MNCKCWTGKPYIRLLYEFQLLYLGMYFAGNLGNYRFCQLQILGQGGFYTHLMWVSSKHLSC
jgi:hypothetical protein